MRQWMQAGVIRAISSVVLASLMTGRPLVAQTYTDRSAWTAAMQSVAGTLDFEGMTPQVGAIWGPVNINGVTIAGDAQNSLSVLRPTWAPVYTDWASGDMLHWEFHGNPPGPATARFTLPNTATGFGFDFGNATSGSYRVTLESGVSFAFLDSGQPTQPRGLTFWGVRVPHAFTWVELTYDDNDPFGVGMFDNITWGEGAVMVVPEPNGASLFVVALVGLLAFRARPSRPLRCSTIADLDDADTVAAAHIGEALRFRPVDPSDHDAPLAAGAAAPS